ncbi:MAG TPA: carboxypeptidase regulatory-like domain-containing protein [Thermoplasmata archaeon]|nr:carboxypeptidase regulatory-like domain-containing protein [Thermoplasmata archaeon]
MTLLIRHVPSGARPVVRGGICAMLTTVLMLLSGLAIASTQAIDGVRSDGVTYASLGGTVKDSAGTPVAGVRVQARNLSAAPETTISASGGFNFSLPAGIYNLVALPDSFAPWHKFVTLTSSGHTEAISLVSGPARGFTLSGTVKGGESGAAIQGANIEVRDRAFQYFVRKSTGAAGDFSFSVPAGDFALDISATGYNARRIETVINADMTGLDLRLVASALGSSISGNVMEVRQAGNVPAQDAMVVISGLHGFATQQKADGAGDYNIPVPSNGSFTVEVFNNSRLAKPKTVSSGATNVNFILPVDVDGPRAFAILVPSSNASVQNPVKFTGQVNDSDGGAARGRILVGQFLRINGGVGEYALRKSFGARGATDLSDSGPLALARTGDGNLSFSFDWDTWYNRGLFTDGSLTANASGTLDHWTWGDLGVPASFRVNAGAVAEPSVALFRKEPGAKDYSLDAVIVNRSGAAWLATKETQQLGQVAPAEIVELVSTSTGDLVGEQERPGAFLDLSRSVTMIPTPHCGRHSVIPIGADYGNNQANSASGLLVDNCPPVAAIQGPSTAKTGSQVTFDGSNSTDDTFIAGYAWKIDGPEKRNGTGMKFTPTPALNTQGNYDVTLTVTDGAGNSGTQTKTLVVSDQPDKNPPTAVAGPDQMVKVGIQFIIDGRKSTDDVGVVKHLWEWFFNGSKKGESAKAFDQIVLDTIGRYQFLLTVEDASANSDQDEMEVRVVNVIDSIPPRADAGGNRLVVQAGAAQCDTGKKHVETGEVRFDGTGSKDEGGSGIVRWTWRISGEGISDEWVNQTSFTHPFLVAGTFQVALEVEDAAFNTDSDAITVEVLAYDSEKDGKGDGLPDAWERIYFGGLQAGPTDDPDGDGTDNHGEMCGLTDPRLPESYSTPPGEGILGMLSLLMPIIVLAVGGAIIALVIRRLKRRGDGPEIPPAT